MWLSLRKVRLGGLHLISNPDLAFAAVGMAVLLTLSGAVSTVVAAGDVSSLQLPARGVVRAVNKATIATDLQARVSAIGFREGQRFSAGDVLVEFDCRRYRAELASVEAQSREAKLLLDNNLVLNEHRAVGSHEVEISRARVDKATGDTDVLRARVDDCRIVAPFNGRVDDLGVHVFETPVAGRPVISIIDDSQLEIELIVPSDWLVWLREGAAFVFNIDELKRAIPARVVRIGAAVDAISQTIKLTAQFAEGANLEGVLSGMSGAADFSPGKG